jgi:hypothetical protein
MNGFRGHVPTLVATAGGTVAAAFVGGLLGAAGTVIGLLLGSLISGTAAWWIDLALRRTADLARQKAAFTRRHRRAPRPDETAVMQAVAARRQRLSPRLIGLIGALGFIAAVAALTVIELGAGKPVSAIVQDKPGSGLTFSGDTTTRDTPSPSPSYSATVPAIPVTPSSPVVTVSPSASTTVPSPVPDPVSSVTSPPSSVPVSSPAVSASSSS